MSRCGLSIRPAVQADAHLLWAWRNDPVTCAMSLNSQAIPWEDHLQWFHQALLDERKVIFLGLEGAIPCGMVRFDRLDERVEVSINLDPTYRGKGLSQSFLSLSVENFQARWPFALTATVKNENQASHRCFVGAGFSLERRDASCSYYLKEMKMNEQDDIAEKLKLIDEIEKIRTANNVNWMDLLRLAFKSSPEETKKLIRRINTDDRRISDLFAKLGE